MKPHPEIKLSAHSQYGNVHASWTDGKFNYHVWVDDDGKPQNATGFRKAHTVGTIYKNTPRQPGQPFKRCQYLDLAADKYAATRDLLATLATPEAIAACKKAAGEKEESEVRQKRETRIADLRLRLIETQVLQSVWADLPEADLLKLTNVFRDPR